MGVDEVMSPRTMGHLSVHYSTNVTKISKELNCGNHLSPVRVSVAGGSKPFL